MRLITFIAITFVLTACATSSGPSVPPYTGTDQVSDVSADAFIGNWYLTIINPRDGQEINPTTVTYSAWKCRVQATMNWLLLWPQ